MDPGSNVAGMYIQPHVTLETLPAEIRYEILGALDYRSLRALVHASPIFHEQYRLDRGSLLRGCLQRTLHAATVDACAAYRSSLSPFSDTRTLGSVTEFLKAYQNRRSAATYLILDEALTEDEVVAIAAFHFTVIEPLTKRYSSWALGHLASEPEGSSHHKPLSATEEARIFRAMYRFQLCCELFHGRRRDYTKPMGFDYFDSKHVSRLFFGLFEPWEVEEVISVHNFSRDEFDLIFRAIHWDVHPENHRFDDQGRPPTPTGAFDFDGGERDSWLGGTVICGLELLHTVLFKMRDHEHLVTTMQERICVDGELFSGAVSTGEHWARRRERYSERDAKQHAREPLPFVGDLESDANGSYPPLAWTLIWKGTYSNLYGDYLDDNIRRWGYVMWDATRLEEEGGKALLLRQWGEWGDDYDPREGEDD